MSLFAWVGAAYGGVLAFAAVTQPIRRQAVAFVAAMAYALVALGAGTLETSWWVTLFVPGGLLLTGYWLSGFYFRDPQAWLEQWLLSIDRALAADRWMQQVPRVVAELLELSYALVHVVIGGGAIYAATIGLGPLTYYWTLVLASGLSSYVPLPWLRSRPPRVLDEQPNGNRTGATSSASLPPPRPVTLRRLNAAILDSASVQANTLPSGHVSGAVAAALGVMAIDPTLGWGMMVLAGVIAIAAIAGRYHYVVDCVAGVAVAFSFWSLM